MAQRVRLELDACKARLRNIRNSRSAEMQNEVDLLEKEFSAACDEAIQEMKTFIQYVHGILTFRFLPGVLIDGGYALHRVPHPGTA